MGSSSCLATAASSAVGETEGIVVAGRNEARGEVGHNWGLLFAQADRRYHNSTAYGPRRTELLIGPLATEYIIRIRQFALRSPFARRAQACSEKQCSVEWDLTDFCWCRGQQETVERGVEDNETAANGCVFPRMHFTSKSQIGEFDG